MAGVGVVSLNLSSCRWSSLSRDGRVAVAELRGPNACSGRSCRRARRNLVTTLVAEGGQQQRHEVRRLGLRSRGRKLWEAAAVPPESVDAHCHRPRVGESRSENVLRSANLVEFEGHAGARGPEIEQQERLVGRRQASSTTLLLCSVPVVLTQVPGRLLAEGGKKEAENNAESFLGGFFSLFDPNETTKQGKKLPKAYLKSAREVVQTLRASFSEDAQNIAKFRRIADSAKGAIREYISDWRGAKPVDAEDSYQALERVLRSLSEFYSKKGPTAVLPEDVRLRILEDLQKADDAL